MGNEAGQCANSLENSIDWDAADEIIAILHTERHRSEYSQHASFMQAVVNVNTSAPGGHRLFQIVAGF